jgi:methylated-DNA-[protein]-cysteine S-methyltransferase
MNDITHDLATPTQVDTMLVETLRHQLADRASAAGLLDLVYRVVDSPVGELLLAATPAGLVRVAYASEDHESVLASLARTVSPRILRDDRAHDYFAGRRRSFDVPVDLRLARGFRLGILQHLRDIPYGQTESYAAVAAAAGSPRAVRAVGSACATNPVPLVVPCHRVVRSDGGMGGYLGGIAAKEYLLRLESAA